MTTFINGGRRRVSRSRHRARWWVALALISGLALTGAAGALTLISDTGTYSVAVTDRTGFEEADVGNALVQYIGDQNETFGAAGSGVFDSFVRLQADGTESGYNTDNNKPEFDTKKGNFTHSILLSDIPTVIEDGVPYWEIFSDINDSDSVPLISLDDVELYLTDDPDLVGYPFTGNADQIYDFDGTIEINDVNQGSGRGDLRYLFPQDDNVPADCTYGNPACETYLILYSAWGGGDPTDCDFGGLSGGCASDGGFEEWKVKKYVVLNGFKYKDVNGDGDRQASEPGLGGWTIRLYSGTTVVDSIVTPASGFYSFTVDPGSYLICEVAQTNWVETEPTGTACTAAGTAPGGYARTVEDGDFGAISGDFGNTPLSDFDVRFFDLTGSTNATIGCVRGSTSVGTSATDESASPETVLTASAQRIGTYTCTITITDP
jgi:hypothetical protein